jgi:L-ascorbate metabolism protein UlaG (beta-lactamase superfamily)
MTFDKLGQGIEWLGHAGFRLKIAVKVVYFEP